MLSCNVMHGPSLYVYFNFDFRERGREEEREGGKPRCERETSIRCLPYMPQPGTEPTTQAFALTRNRAGDPSVCRTTPKQLNHTGRGSAHLFSSHTSPSVFQRGHVTLDQHLEIQGSLFGQENRRKGFPPPSEPLSLLPRHHPAPIPVPGDLLTICYLWVAVPTPQKTELSSSTNSKALAKTAAKEMT